MKQLLVFILSVIVSLKVFSQSDPGNSRIGYFIDINNNLVPGYCDKDYNPQEQLVVTFEIGAEYTPGYFYNRTLKKTPGLLKYSQLDALPTFKADKNSVGDDISPNDCSGYVIGADSFAIITNFDVERTLGGFKSNRREFAEVIETAGNLAFYKHTRTGMNNIVYTYLVKADSASTYISFPKSVSKFKETCLPIFGGFASLKDQIEKGEYIAEDIPIMAKLLKYKWKFDHQERIYYTTSWDEVDEVNKSAYYAVIESLKDSIFHFKYYSNDDVPVYEGSYSSFYPEKKTGEFTWYFPNGKTRKTIVYQNNKPELTTLFYPNGNKQSEYYTDYTHTVYKQVYTANGEEIFDNSGNGQQLLYDSVSGRMLTYDYTNYKLRSSYFIDNSGRKVYQKCEKNAEISNLKQFQKQLSKKVEYPLNSIRDYTHGIVLVKCIVEPTGLVSDIQIIKGLNPECDSLIINYLAIMSTEKTWTSAMIAKQKVPQEVVVPVEFAISGFSRYRNNYNYYWMQNPYMMHNNLMMNPNLQPKLPTNIRTSW
jgi:hypothetical protein